MIRSYDSIPKLRLDHEVSVSDSTLREGAQMPGIVFKLEHRLKVYQYLHRIGIEKLELFLFHPRDKQAASKMLELGYQKPKVTGWARARKSDIDHVLEVDGIDETGILMSVSDAHIFDKLGFESRDQASQSYLEAMDYALEHGLKVRCHLEDITRADPQFITEFCSQILKSAPEAILRICDTVNYGVHLEDAPLPMSIPKLVRMLKQLGAKHVEIHAHDDFGLSIAVTISALWAGADWANLTFLGIGERAGLAELEKLLLFLRFRTEGYTKYDLSCLNEFARYMESQVGIRVPRNKAVVGHNVFSHESGIHVAGVLKNPFTYEPYPPELVGAQRQIFVGASSGTEAIAYKASEALKDLLNLEVKISKDDPRIISMYNEIQSWYELGERVSSLSDEELKALVEKYFIFTPIIEKDLRRKLELEEKRSRQTTDSS